MTMIHYHNSYLPKIRIKAENLPIHTKTSVIYKIEKMISVILVELMMIKPRDKIGLILD